MTGVAWVLIFLVFRELRRLSLSVVHLAEHLEYDLYGSQSPLLPHLQYPLSPCKYVMTVFALTEEYPKTADSNARRR